MTGRFSALCGVAVSALAVAGVGSPASAQSQAPGGTVTLTAEQWQAIQQELAQLHQDVDQLKAGQQSTQAQATQAQAAAVQAQSTADDAKTVAKTAASDAIKPFAWAKDTTISGRMYFSGSNIDREVNGNKTESDGGFQIKRFYLGVDHKFNSVLSGNITTDVSEIGGTGQALYIKKAYLQAKFSPAFAVRLGSADLPWVPYVEGLYGYRYVENVMIETDYPHTDSLWPHSLETAHKSLEGRSDADKYKVLQGNARRVFNFEPAPYPVLN